MHEGFFATLYWLYFFPSMASFLLGFPLSSLFFFFSLVSGYGKSSFSFLFFCSSSSSSFSYFSPLDLSHGALQLFGAIFSIFWQFFKVRQAINGYPKSLCIGHKDGDEAHSLTRLVTRCWWLDVVMGNPATFVGFIAFILCRLTGVSMSSSRQVERCHYVWVCGLRLSQRGLMWCMLS